MSVSFRKSQWLESTSLFDCTWEYFDWWYLWGHKRIRARKFQTFKVHVTARWTEPSSHWHTELWHALLLPLHINHGAQWCVCVCAPLCVLGYSGLSVPSNHSLKHTEKLFRLQNSWTVALKECKPADRMCCGRFYFGLGKYRGSEILKTLFNICHSCSFKGLFVLLDGINFREAHRQKFLPKMNWKIVIQCYWMITLIMWPDSF